jgi:hypothetical protein
MTRLKMLLRSLTAVLVLSSGAMADDPPAAPPSDGEREGFLIGFSIGFGATFPCDTCANFASEFHVGAMASRNLAVLAEIGGVGGDDRSGGGLLMATIGAQYWPVERFWIKGGVGIGDALDDQYGNSQRQWGATAAVGYEVASRGRFAFDVQARGGFTGDRQSFGVSVGFHWY